MRIWDRLNTDKFWTDSNGVLRIGDEPEQRTMIRRWIQGAITDQDKDQYLRILKKFDAAWVTQRI